MAVLPESIGGAPNDKITPAQSQAPVIGPEAVTPPVKTTTKKGLSEKLKTPMISNTETPRSISPEDYQLYIEESSYLSNNKDKYGNLLDKKESAAIVKERKAVLQDIESQLPPNELLQIKKDSIDYVPLPGDTSNGFDTPKTEYVLSKKTNSAIDEATRVSMGDNPPENTFKLGTISNNKITGGLSSLLSRNFTTSRFLNNIRIAI